MRLLPALLPLIFCCLTGANAGGITPAEAHDFYTAVLSSHSQTLASVPRGGPQCAESYAGLFRKDTLAISVFLGFTDSSIPGLVLDRPIKRALVTQLTRGCPRGLLACGFASAPGPEDGPAVLTKTLRVDDRNKTVLVKIFDSSVSESSRECGGPLRGRQQARSAAEADEYAAALGRDDIVLYMGHSRYGTGPGFYPVSFTSPSAVRAYIERPLLPRMRAALKGRSAPPAALGFISCNSEKYYADLAHSASPGSALLISSDDSTHPDNARTLLGFIDSVLGRRCFGDLGRSVNSAAGRTFSLYGFFGEAPHHRYHRHTPVMLVLAALLIIPFLMVLTPLHFAGSCDLLPGTPEAPFRGSIFLAASLLPGLLAAGLLRSGWRLALPLVLSTAGYIVLAIAIIRDRTSNGGPRTCAAVVLPPLSIAAAGYFCLTFLPELSARNAAHASLQALTLILVFAALLPFFLFTSAILPQKGPESAVKGFVRSAALNLALYIALALGLNLAGTPGSVSLISVTILALYLHGVSYMLRGRFGGITGPAFFQALTMALICTEGLQIFLYN